MGAIPGLTAAKLYKKVSFEFGSLAAAGGQTPVQRRFRLTRYGENRWPASSQAPTRRRREVLTIGDMKILNFIHVMVARSFYSWAMKEINPMHPDVPRIMQRQRELEDKAQRIFA